MPRGLDARAAELFMQALGLSGPHRASFLDEACANDEALRAEVDSLLAADADLTRHAPPRPEAVNLAGTRIGQYRLLRLLGSGGMGAVYEAEQDNPRRSVALKVMRPGLVGQAALKRFEYESQILGRLRHPGIAQVFEAGEHTLPDALPGAGAVPFFAMEFIEGARTLFEHCDSRGLGVRERLELVARVCDAAHHGHQKGVIHRDLKPGNILIDASGQPKVIDFGVARTTDADMAAATIDSGAHQLVGTLRYMSPEQCGGDPAAIDTRSDVYSLGVVLYELLTGRLPYELDGKSIYEAPAIIREQQPVRPAAIVRALRGDVETIVLKALEKDRDRRYASAAGFAADIRRFLRSEPIAARPPSTTYQLRMFARRNPGLVFGVAAAFVALAIGMALAVRQTLRAHAALDRAERQAYVAEIAAADGAVRAEDGGTAMARLRSAPARLRGWEWHHLASRADGSIRKWEFPGASIPLAVAAPSGSHVLVHDTPDTCSLRDASTGKSVWRSPSDGCFHRAFSLDGAYVTIARASGVSVVDARNGAALSQVDLRRQDVLAVCMHPDGRRLATAGTDGHVRVYDWRERRLLHDFVAAPEAWIWDVQFSPDGTVIAYNEARSVLLRDADSGRVIREIACGDEPAGTFTRAMLYSPDGTILAEARGSLVRLLDPQMGAVRRVLSGHTHQITDLAFGAGGTTLVAAGTDRTVRVWSITSDEPPMTLLGHANIVESVGLCLNATQIVSSSHDGTVRFWEARPLGAALDTGMPWTASVSFTPSGEGLLTIGGNIAKLWDLASGRAVRVWPVGELHTSFGCPGAISPDGRLIAIGADGPLLRAFDAADGRERWTAREDQGVRVESIAFSPDGSLIASTDQQRLQVRDVAQGALVHERPMGEHGAWAAQFSPDGHLLALANEARAFRLLHATTGRDAGEVRDLPASVASVAFSPDSGQIAAGMDDGSVAVWDLRAWHQVVLLTGMQPGVWSVAFSPDGSRLAAGSKDRAIHLWDAVTWVELLTLRGHNGTVRDLAWSRDGRKLASAAMDGTARVWEAPAFAPADGR